MALTTKRLCERWLDNMFMVLYEVKYIYIYIYIYIIKIKIINDSFIRKKKKKKKKKKNFFF